MAQRLYIEQLFFDGNAFKPQRLPKLIAITPCSLHSRSRTVHFEQNDPVSTTCSQEADLQKRMVLLPVRSAPFLFRVAHARTILSHTTTVTVRNHIQPSAQLGEMRSDFVERLLAEALLRQGRYYQIPQPEVNQFLLRYRKTGKIFTGLTRQALPTRVNRKDE